MTAPLIWIILPMLWGAGCLFLRALRTTLYLLSAGFALALAWIAWQIPIDTALEAGPITLKISSTLIILGRNFSLLNADRPLLILIYLTLAFWLLGGYLVKPTSLFIGTSQIIVALMVAALSVEPFLYAALLIAIAVLLSVPMLAPPGQAPGPGLLRYVSFQLFGVPFILFVGWLLTGVEASPSNLGLVLRAGVLVALGFAFLQAVFPFHSWIPMLAGESNPFVVGFLLCFLPMTVSVFGLGFIDRYAWLRDTQLVFQMLLAVGAVISLLGGVWAAIQNHLGRQLGFAMVFDIGLSLMAIGLAGAQSVQFSFAIFLPRVVSLLVGCIALAGLRSASGSLLLDDQAPVVRRHPFLLFGAAFSIFTFGAMPLSAGFPPKMALFAAVWEQAPLAASAGLMGAAGLIIAALRTVNALAMPLLAPHLGRTQESLLGQATDTLLPDTSNPYAWLFLAFTIVSLFGTGLFPQFFYGSLSRFLPMFPQLVP